MGWSGGLIYVASGTTSTGLSESNAVYVYDPSADTWAPRPALPTPRQQLGADALNGILYVGGGLQASNTTTAALEADTP